MASTLVRTRSRSSLKRREVWCERSAASMNVSSWLALVPTIAQPRQKNARDTSQATVYAGSSRAGGKWQVKVLPRPSSLSICRLAS